MSFKKISVYVSPKQLSGLKKLAKESHRSWASHLREAIEDYVNFERDPEACGITPTQEKKLLDDTGDFIPYAGENYG